MPDRLTDEQVHEMRLDAEVTVTDRGRLSRVDLAMHCLALIAERDRLKARVAELRQASKTPGCERCDRAGEKCMRCIG